MVVEYTGIVWLDYSTMNNTHVTIFREDKLDVAMGISTDGYI